MNKAKMIKHLQKKIELGTESDLYNCPDNEPEFMPFTIAALVLTNGELKEVPNKVLELLRKSIEHDLIMEQAIKAGRPSFFKCLLKRVRL